MAMEVAAEKDGRRPLDLEQPLGERRLLRLAFVAHVERSFGQHGAAGQELQRGRILGSARSG